MLPTPELQMLFDTINFQNIVEPHDIDPLKLIDSLKRHRLFPIFYAKWKTYGGFEVEGFDWEKFNVILQQLVSDNQMKMLAKSTALVQVAKAFHSAGLPFVSFKGPVLSQYLYHDIAMKASLDLDILVTASNFNKASQILANMGYISELDVMLTVRQENYLLHNFHHLAFHRAGIFIEVHWRLHTNPYLVERPVRDYFASLDSVDIAGYRIPTLSKTHLVEYLMVHGAYHSWARLDWLYDFSSAIVCDMHNESDFLASIRKNKLEIIFHQSIFLANQCFNLKINGFEKPASEYLLRRNMKDIEGPLVSAGKQNFITRLRQKYYLFQLKNSFKYHLHIFSVLGTNIGDWKILRLPDFLFFLYFVLRPGIYVWGKSKKVISDLH